MSENLPGKRPADGAVSPQRTLAASELVGKTIADAVVRGHWAECDGENVLVLTMTDGTAWEVEGGYLGYSGRSCDEYVETVSVWQTGGASC